MDRGASNKSRRDRAITPAPARLNPREASSAPGAWDPVDYWQPGSLKLAIRVCQPAALEAWPAVV
jgi:hypothetical protein